MVGTTRGEGEEVSEQGQGEDEERKSDASRRRYKQPKAAPSIFARNNCNPGTTWCCVKESLKINLTATILPSIHKSLTKF